jgi:hypothetical protein
MRGMWAPAAGHFTGAGPPGHDSPGSGWLGPGWSLASYRGEG